MQQRILFVSFLKAVRHGDLNAWRVIVLCIFLQLGFLLIKLEATPFFLFGMFSEKMHRADTITVPVVLLNGTPISVLGASAREAQLVETTALNYIEMKRNNNTDPVRTRIETRYPFIYNSSLYSSLSPRLYNRTDDMELYKSWLKDKCLRATGARSGVVSIGETKYIRTKQGTGLVKFSYETLETF